MEQQLLFLINRQWTSPALDLFMAAMSSFDLWIVPLIITAVCLLIFGGFKGRAFVLVAGLLVGISDGGVSQHLKKLALRPRPHEVLADVRRVDLRRAKPKVLALFQKPKTSLSRPEAGKQGGNSFPSSHTVNNFCLAMVAAAFYRRRGALVFLIAASVGYSRVYVGSHWPSDVVASAFLGCGIALLGLPLCEWVWRKAAGRWAPAFLEAHPSLLEKQPA